MFVQYDCGCIGFPPDEDGSAIIVLYCDSEEGPEVISFFRRDMTRICKGKQIPKNFKELTEVGEAQIITKIQRQLSEGYRYREIRRLLS